MDGLDKVRDDLFSRHGFAWPVTREEFEEQLKDSQLSRNSAEAALLKAFTELYACYFQEAEQSFLLVHDIYSETSRLNGLDAAILEWALARVASYNHDFSVAERLYESAISMLNRLKGGADAMTRACLEDYRDFLQGFVRDDINAALVDAFLHFTDPNFCADGTHR